jgi:hypothetical protein
MKPGLKIHQGHPAGRDPREMTPDELKAAGHLPRSPLQTIRARCVDCCAYQEKEVALCPTVDCPSWPFRMGTDPWRKPASKARREAARQVMTKLNASRQKGDGTAPTRSPPDDGTAPFLAAGSEAAPTLATAASIESLRRYCTEWTGEALGRAPSNPRAGQLPLAMTWSHFSAMPVTGTPGRSR